MPNAPVEIPALPVVVPLAVLIFAALLWRLRRRGAVNIARAVVVGILCVYGAGVIGNTLLPIFIGAASSGLPWWSSINLRLLENTDAADMLQNIAVFAPLGILLPLATRIRSLGGVVLAGFLISLAMELLQFVNAVAANGGHIADVNDLLANTVGAPLGFGLYRAALLLPAARRWAHAATWPTAAPRTDHETVSPR
ncbi:VanZ family protein [Parafrigoribacterium soli]|uniref:VanZ family protein n=1 Tax=Parafrigoribacterium soli TaxID=3144663 RepID=UPI0032EDE4E3